MWMSKLEKLMKLSNIEHDQDKLVIEGKEVLGLDEVDGVKIDVDSRKDLIKISIRILEGVKLDRPVHLCFGVLDASFNQNIDLTVECEPNSRVEVVGHCTFPFARNVMHVMNGVINLHEKASFKYFEKHVHSSEGGIVVNANADVNLAESAFYGAKFELLEGRVGDLNIDYQTIGATESKVDMLAKVSGHADDFISINESSILKGVNSRSVLESRVAVRDSAQAEVYNKVVAEAEGCKGHIDCSEILQGDGVVKAFPVIEAKHPKARVTHEASLGGVDNKQLDTLMAKGLSEEEAQEMIIKGLLA